MENQIKPQPKGTEPSKMGGYTWLLLSFVFFIGIAVVVGVIFGGDPANVPTEDPGGSSIVNNREYLYKVRYDFGQESYIYVWDNYDISFITRSEIYEIVPDCNCMEPTGRYKEEEKAIYLNNENKEIVLDTIAELSDRSNGRKEFDAEDAYLSSREERVLLAVALNDEDRIGITTFQNYYETKTGEYRSQFSQAYSVNQITKINDKTNNTVLNAIASYINPIAQSTYDKYAKQAAYYVDNDKVGNAYHVSVKAKIVYIGVFDVSVTITTDCNFGDRTVYDEKGYMFHYGEGVVDEIPSGMRKDLIDQAIVNFTKTSMYKQYANQLSPTWRKDLEKHLPELGNWYVSDERGITFIVPRSVIGLDSIAPGSPILLKVSAEEF